MQTKLIMKIKSAKKLLYCSFGAGLGFCLLGAVSLKADTLVTFSVDMGTNILNNTFTPGGDTISVHGSFDGWTTGVTLVQEGSGTVYTNTVDDTTDANGGVLTYKYVNSHTGTGYENLSDGNNRAVVLPSVSGSSLVLPTPFFGDAGQQYVVNNVTFQVDMSEQIVLGYFTNGTGTIQVSGTFNGWTPASGALTRDTSIVIPEPGGVLTSNVYTGTFTSVAVSSNAAMGYKFVMNGNYEGSPILSDGANRFYTMTSTPITFPVVFYADTPYSAALPPLVSFSVDMSIVVLTDTNYNPASVTVNGDLMGWGGVPMTNNPSAANTNIYTSAGYYDAVGASVNYQFRYTLLSSSSSIVYDHANGANGGGGNRLFVVPNVTSTNVYAVFNDAELNDYLTQPTPVLFSVDMNGAVGTDSHTFDPSQDAVYINGTFANWYAWESGSAPAPAPPGYQMVEQGLTTIYTNTIIIPAGNTPEVIYKYGMDPAAAYGGPLDDEGGFGLNHVRAVRATAFNPYVMPTDKFGNQYAEPYFSSSSRGGGNLTIGAPSGGSVPVTWLGRPGAHLQVTSDLVSGSWQDLIATDGTNWTVGYSSTNGFVSQTNWPASSKAFFRLVKP